MLRLLRPTAQAVRHTTSVQQRTAAARFAAPLLSSSALQRWNTHAIAARSISTSAARLARSSKSEAAEAAAEAAAEEREQAEAEQAGREYDDAAEDAEVELATARSTLGWSQMTRRQLHEALENPQQDNSVIADVLPEILESSHHSSGMAEIMGDEGADVSPLDQELPGAELWDAEPLEMDDPFEPDAELDEREEDESHVADNRFTFEEEVVDPQWLDEHGEDEDAQRVSPRMKKIIVDRQGIPLRHKDEYSTEEREAGEEFPGFIVQIQPKDTVEEDMEGTKDPLRQELMEEPQSEDLDYKVETDPDHHWYLPGVLDTQSVKEGEDEYIVGAGATSDAPKRYLIGGKEVPQTIWQGRKWLTFPRTWEDIRKNGKYPSTAEVEAHIATILGEPRPDIPISPPREPKPQEYIWTSSSLLDEADDLMDDAEWKKEQTQLISPKTWFMEARQRYKKKLHLVRIKYLKEYTHVKTMHDENILARWQQQMVNRAAKLSLKERRAEVHRQTIIDQQRRAAQRRGKRRLISRFTRMNKEMKLRRLHLHIFNYILRERELHWIHPQVSASGEVVHNKNLTTKLFEKDSFVQGFWPKHPMEERQERMDEIARRKAAKAATR